MRGSDASLQSDADLPGEVLLRHQVEETFERAGVEGAVRGCCGDDDLRFTDSLPKTRSGKIMRRLLRDVAAGRESTGDTTTLEDLSVLARLRDDDDV